MSDDATRLLIVEARFSSDLADELLRGATAALDAYGAQHEVVTVPSALHIPAAIAMAEEGGHRPAGGAPFDGYVALAALVRDESYEFEVAATETVRGLTELAVGRKLAIGLGILMVDEEADAWAAARVSEGDRGGAAAQAALGMVAVRQQMLGARR